jgi:hypothetical protein
MTQTASGCADVDKYGNIAHVLNDPTGLSADRFVEVAIFPAALDDASVLCKHCALELGTKTTSGATISWKRLRYDAPLGTFEPASNTTLTKGHLNYVEELEHIS